MAVRVIHASVSRHILAGAHTIYFEGVKYLAVDALGASLMGPPPGTPAAVTTIAAGTVITSTTQIQGS